MGFDCGLREKSKGKEEGRAGLEDLDGNSWD